MTVAHPHSNSTPASAQPMSDHSLTQAVPRPSSPWSETPSWPRLAIPPGSRTPPWFSPLVLGKRMKRRRHWAAVPLSAFIIMAGAVGVCYELAEVVVGVRESATPVTIARSVALVAGGVFVCLGGIDKLRQRAIERPYGLLAAVAIGIAVLLEILAGTS
jgi:hypothetical protein